MRKMLNQGDTSRNKNGKPKTDIYRIVKHDNKSHRNEVDKIYLKSPRLCEKSLLIQQVKESKRYLGSCSFYPTL